jgi:aryl-alcohol dehydrogenase-like predicted oxidoreductase
MSDIFKTTAMTRKEFLTTLAAGTAALGLSGLPAFAAKPLATRKIPKSGEAMPVIGIGTSRVFDIDPGDPDAMTSRQKVLDLLYGGGGRMVDTAPSYGNAEEVLGVLIPTMKARGKTFLASKVRTSGVDEGKAEMEQSFKLLKTDKIDLMYVHNLRDTDTQLKTIREWKQAGRFRYDGVTHFRVEALPDLIDTVAKVKPDFVQMIYSLDSPDAAEKLLPLCADQGTAVVINRAFERGKLFKKAKGKAIPEWAKKELDCASWAQFFLKFALGHKAVVCVIPGTDKPKYMIDNLGAGQGPLPDAKQSKKMLDFWRSL